MPMSMSSSINFALLTLVAILIQHTQSFYTKEIYIVYMGSYQHGLNPTERDLERATKSHIDLLKSVLDSEGKAREALISDYVYYINGFAASLTEKEAENLKSSDAVVSVFKIRKCNLSVELRPHDYRNDDDESNQLKQHDITPKESLKSTSKHEKDVIIGVIYTGAWPESKDFNDQGFGPIPSRWKGVCMRGSHPTFKCNKKLIGARYFDIDGRDYDKHDLLVDGDNYDKGVDIYGFEKGVDKRGSANVRVAAYKIGLSDVQFRAVEFLTAFEDAIRDGVDVLSIQVKEKETLKCSSQVIAIGTREAVRHGITVFKGKPIPPV